MVSPGDVLIFQISDRVTQTTVAKKKEGWGIWGRRKGMKAADHFFILCLFVEWNKAIFFPSWNGL